MESGIPKGVEHARWRDVNANPLACPIICYCSNPWSKVVSSRSFAKQAVQRNLLKPDYANTNH